MTHNLSDAVTCKGLYKNWIYICECAYSVQAQLGQVQHSSTVKVELESLLQTVMVIDLSNDGSLFKTSVIIWLFVFRALADIFLICHHVLLGEYIVTIPIITQVV